MENPRTILITGASSGIGAALALHYAAPGVTLFLAGRNAERLAATAAACRARGTQVYERVQDVTDCAGMAAWIGACDDKAALDLVIANAGISGGTGGAGGVIAGEPGAQAQKIFDINVNGVLNTVTPAQERMTGRGRGQIAIMSSLASFAGWPGAPAYSASKAAVRFYGEALRGALLHTGVRVNVICPGFIVTPMTAVNGYKMPFMMDAPRAARIIAAGLARDRGRIAFPRRTYVLAALPGFLPPGLALGLLRRMPAKPAGPESA